MFFDRLLILFIHLFIYLFICLFVLFVFIYFFIHIDDIDRNTSLLMDLSVIYLFVCFIFIHMRLFGQKYFAFLMVISVLANTVALSLPVTVLQLVRNPLAGTIYVYVNLLFSKSNVKITSNSICFPPGSSKQ